MQKQAVVHEAPLKDFKRTKIIATVGPSTNSHKAILALLNAGVDGIRLNFSHGNHEERTQQIKWVRQAEKECGRPVAIIQDLQGPKIRLGDFDDSIEIKRGNVYSFEFKPDYKDGGNIPLQYDLSKKVKRGERMFLFDGRVRMTVVSVAEGVVRAEAQNDGELLKRKGINLPDTDFAGDIITPKDKADLIYGSAQDIDYVALSFAQSVSDVTHLRRLLRNMNSTASIIAKIETKAAVDNLEEIVEASDMVMIARGDLAVETEAESVPIVQRKVIGLGRRYAKPTIVATQMLDSMNDASEPTRAEVSDIASAVIVGADCVMLSDETASGSYPIEAVNIMRKVIVYTESHTPLQVSFPSNQELGRQAAICTSVISLAESVGAKAIVSETKSGATARQIASRRVSVPTIAVTNVKRVAQQLAVVYGVRSYQRPLDPKAATKLTAWLRQNKVLHKGDIVVLTMGQYPGVVGTTDTIKVRVLE